MNGVIGSEKEHTDVIKTEVKIKNFTEIISLIFWLTWQFWCLNLN